MRRKTLDHARAYGLLRRALTMIEDAYFLIEEYERRSDQDRERIREAIEALKKAMRDVDEVASRELMKYLEEFS
jgi:F0F1-type ATP synthase epsilon subunit